MKSLQLNFLKVAAMAALVAGCGGGGGSGGSTSNPPPSGGGTTSGKTTFVTGAIAGFGSVIVNGVRYDTDSAQVSIEDKPSTAAQLRVGEVIRLTAEVDAQGVARAKSIQQDHLLQGAVQAVDVAAGTLTIAGQVITVDNETMFDDSIPTRSLAGIAVGDLIEVHGFVSAGGGARATRLEKAGAGETEVEVTGLVATLDAGAMRFSIGSLVVDYSSATLDGFGGAGPALGDLVEVKGTSYLADGALRAVRVEHEDERDDGASGDGSEIEGLVTRFVSATDFDVAGRKVTTTSSTSFVNGSAGDLQLNAKVEVEGTFDAAGTLVAAKVAFKRQSSVRLAAPVESVDAAGGTFRALGLTVVVTSTTRKEDHESDDHFFSLDALRVGDWVEVGGYADPSGNGRPGRDATRARRARGRSRAARSGDRAHARQPQGLRRQRRPAAGHRVRGRRHPHHRQPVPRTGRRPGRQGGRQLERRLAGRGRGRDRARGRRRGAAGHAAGDAAAERWQPAAGRACRQRPHGDGGGDGDARRQRQFGSRGCRAEPSPGCCRHRRAVPRSCPTRRPASRPSSPTSPAPMSPR